jgi:hypothetical protein
MEAVAVHTLFIIAVTVIFLFFALAVFFGWLKINEQIANPTICNSNLLGYCTEWSHTDYQTVPYDWSQKDPGCVKINISPTLDGCKALLGQK